MKTRPHIIELCGIPYSRKTTTLNNIDKLLKNSAKRCYRIEEYNGKSSGFYEKAKYTPDLNIVRSLKSLEKVIRSIHSGSCDYILIDRGPFDSYCWLKWFSEKNNKSDELEQLKILSTNLMHTVKNYSSKYHIAWMDMRPELSVSGHGRQGSIVNINTLSELQYSYMEAIDEHHGSKDIRTLTVAVSPDKSSEFYAKHIARRCRIKT